MAFVVVGFLSLWSFLNHHYLYPIQAAVQAYFSCSLIVCHAHVEDYIARRCVITSQIEKERERERERVIREY